MSQYSVLLLRSYLEVFSEASSDTTHIRLHLTETVPSDRKLRELTAYLHNSSGAENRH